MLVLLPILLLLGVACLESSSTTPNFDEEPTPIATDAMRKADRDESYADNYANSVGCGVWARFIDRHARRLARHSMTYSHVDDTSFERSRSASLHLNFLLDLEDFEFSTWRNAETDSRILDALSRTKDYGQRLLEQRRSNTFEERAFIFSYLDNLHVRNAQLTGHNALNGPTLGQLCLAGGFEVPNTHAFTGTATHTQVREYSGSDYVTLCTRYADGVDHAYASVAPLLSEAPPAERHRLAIILDGLHERWIASALLQTSTRRLARTLQSYEPLDPSDPDFLEKVNAYEPTRVAESNDLSSTFTVVLGQLGQLLGKIGIHFSIASVITDDVNAYIDAATMDMLTISSTCKEAGLPYADAHRGIV